MNALICSLAACAIALLFCIYQAYRVLLGRQRKKLCRRVAFMLWVAADRSEGQQSRAKKESGLTPL